MLRDINANKIGICRFFCYNDNEVDRMKKLCLILILLCFISGCKKEEKEETKVLATGELVCAYKENRIKEDTLYTSLYQYNFNDNGVLEELIDAERIEFVGTDEEIKEKYLETVDETLKKYENIDGVTATKEIEDDKCTILIKIDPKKLKDELKEDYMVNYDRVNTYKLFTDMGYTCEQ